MTAIFTQCISAVCTLGLVLFAVLVMMRVVSFEDTMKSIGKNILLLFVLVVAVSSLLPALTLLLATLVRWLVVTVLVIAAVMFLIRLWRFDRPNANSRRD
jgi:DMSO/TMAO reductase YedYZ heme-binding membrane subunit